MVALTEEKQAWCFSCNEWLSNIMRNEPENIKMSTFNFSFNISTDVFNYDEAALMCVS